MKTILIVDDDPAIRELIHESLSENFNVVSAHNGKIAFEIVLNSNVDLIISDIDMPIMNGIEFLQNVRAKKIQTPIIMMSGNLRYTERDIVTYGANKFIFKLDYTPALLGQWIQSLIY